MADRGVKDPKLAVARMRELMIDPARFSSDAEVIAAYAAAGADDLLAAVFPRGVEDVRQVLGVARDFKLSVYTPMPWGLEPPSPGVVVDFRYMADVAGVDSKNLYIEVEPGVTWEQALSELEDSGVRLALPASAKSPYVLESALEREVVLAASRFTNRQLSTFHAVLADGREYRSGSDALPNSAAHWREDGGPNISRIFTGSRNSFGLPLRGFLFLYPEPEGRKVVTRGVPNRQGACALARDAARCEIGTEVIVLSKPKAKHVLGADPGLPTWTVVFGLEGPKKLIAYQQKRLDQIAAGLKLKPKKGAVKLDNAVARALDVPWYAPEISLGFYTNFDKVEKISKMAESSISSKGKLAQMIIPVKRGASVYVQYDVLDPTRDAANAVKRLLPRLSDAGAFFANPTGSLATHIFGKQPEYARFLKDVKRLMDPDNILNTGQVVEV